MKPVMHYQVDTSACDIALREDVQSKVRPSMWTTLVMDVLSRQIVGVESHVSPLDQKALKRLLGRLGKRRGPNNRRSS